MAFVLFLPPDASMLEVTLQVWFLLLFFCAFLNPFGPVQVLCMILDTWGWCTETTLKDGTGREEGGGFKMGNTCIRVADSC